MPDLLSLAQRVRSRREEKGWSREELARQARLSEGTIKNVESGRHSTTLATLTALAAALDLPDLVGAAPEQSVPRAELIEALRLVKKTLDVAMVQLDEAVRVAEEGAGADAKDNDHSGGRDAS